MQQVQIKMKRTLCKCISLFPIAALLIKNQFYMDSFFLMLGMFVMLLMIFTCKEDADGITSWCAIILLLSGISNFYDHIYHGNKSFSTLFESACYIVCCIEYFKLLIRNPAK